MALISPWPLVWQLPSMDSLFDQTKLRSFSHIHTEAKCRLKWKQKLIILSPIAWYFPWHQLSGLETHHNNSKANLSQARAASGEPPEGHNAPEGFISSDNLLITVYHCTKAFCFTLQRQREQKFDVVWSNINKKVTLRGSEDLSVVPPLWSRLKYLNTY